MMPTKRVIDVDALAASETPPPQLWDLLVQAAVQSHASDIHMSCQAGGLHVALRIDGMLHEQGVVFPTEAAWRLVNHIKVQAEIDLGERRRPQNGRTRATVADRRIDLRISPSPPLTARIWLFASWTRACRYSSWTNSG
jgi:type II secretory ATPase GspE/PulE/Tfp pilus assembly ATPase PilB-like protein